MSEKTDVHPLELAAKKERAQADVYRQLQPNQALLTNLPIYSDVFKSAHSVRNFMLDKVDKDL